MEVYFATLGHTDHDLFQSSDWDLGHIYRYKVNIAIVLFETFPRELKPSNKGMFRIELLLEGRNFQTIFFTLSFQCICVFAG